MTIYYIYQLPYQLIEKIWHYLPMTTKIFISRNDYIENHNVLYDNKIIKSRDNYIRDMIRNDYDFVFNFIVKESIYDWIRIRRIFYREIIYGSYLQYLMDLTVDHNASKCRKILMNEMSLCGLSKNLSKKKRIKNSKWTN